MYWDAHAGSGASSPTDSTPGDCRERMIAFPEGRASSLSAGGAKPVRGRRSVFDGAIGQFRRGFLVNTDDFRWIRRVDGLQLVNSADALTGENQVVFAAELPATLFLRRSSLSL